MRLKIHHPLPLNARESRALLNLLTSSFRNNLDAEHSNFESVQSGAQGEAHTKRQRSTSVGEGNHADRHLQSVLTNPLFSSAPRRTTRAVGDGVVNKDPMKTFDRAVAMGMMNIRYASACLHATKRRIITSSVLNVRDGMRETGAGMKVLSWLKSSGTENDLQFLQNQQFAEVLMDFVVAEGLQEAAWKWIKMAFENIPASSFLQGHELKIAQVAMAWPLFCLVRAETQGQDSLDAAFLCMSRAAGYLNGISVDELRPILSRAGVYILQKTLSTHNDRPSPTESNFESFVSLIPSFLKTYGLYIAHLSLIHPTKPDAGLALNYLSSIKPTSSSEKLSERQMSLGLDTANFLLQRNQQSEVNWILDLLRTKFPQEIEDGERSKIEQAKAEATSLDILARLGFS